MKKSYSLTKNFLFMLKKTWYIDKTLLMITFVQVPVIVLLPLLATYLSKYTVQLVTQNTDINILVFNILLLSLVMFILHIINNYANAKIEWRSFGSRFLFLELCNEKIIDMDYETLENPDGQNKMQKAQDTLMNINSGIQQMFAQIISIMSNIAGLITYSIILMSFNLWIVLFLFLMTMISYFFCKINNQWHHKNKDYWVSIDRKIKYIQTKSGDFEAAKDVRIYRMGSWFGELFEKFLKQRIFWWKKSEGRSFFVDAVAAVMNFFRDGISYVYLIYQTVHGTLSVEEFVLYFSLITQYSSWLMGIVRTYASLKMTSLDICDLREFLDLKDRFNRDKGIDIPDTAPEIKLKNVSFRYPGCNDFTLKNINLVIKPKEKIAIVGLNGAGKTTLVKLLCGLYTPTEGEILINDRSISEYNINQYYSMLSVVFQDIMLMPVSIAKNIALCNDMSIDANKLSYVLKLSGLYEKVQTLPEKENTVLLKSIQDDAVDLSGGEKQKLALARALYKKGTVMILDEPTAALDPIAENEIYIKYNDLVKDATSVFISHRLASTRFCNNILFLENGRIIEQGSHYELMKQDGKYAELFKVQSHYYRENV